MHLTQQTDTLTARALMEWLLACNSSDEMHHVIGEWLRANPAPATDLDWHALHHVLAELAEIPRRIVAESGLPGASDTFDAEAWLHQWARTPHPALGGERPADVLLTPDGVARVRQLLMQQQSGAYA